MKKLTPQIYLAITGICCSVIFGCSQEQKSKNYELAVNESPRSHLLFDFNWHFQRGDITGGEAVDLDDSNWRILDLPHDWSIEDIPGTDSPLDSNSTGGISMGYYMGGTAWYRKKFTVPPDFYNKRIHINFEGIYMNADIWLNGEHLGNHPYGYASFWIDITDHIRFAEENILAVQVKNEGKNSRWYSGSGIYRHVWMLVTNTVHVAPWGTYITTPEVSESSATVNIKTNVNNAQAEPVEIEIHTRIVNQSGVEVASLSTGISIESNELSEVSQDLIIESPLLWSPGSPALYTTITEIIDSESNILDRVETIFGVRTIEFSVEKGFLLNGNPTMLKGGCMHHDNGPLGAATYDRAEERRVELMKASGFNSIRCAHNPPSPAFLEACDRLGILVIDEAFDMWRKPKNPEDYSLYFDDWWQKDIESMVLRDRNHPSIIMWSTGNEIPERGQPEGFETSRMLAEYVRKLDPTRPVTSAVNGLGPDKDPYFATLDISGYNYSFGGDHGQKSIYKRDHERHPNRVMYCSESYPLEAFGAWMDVLDYPYVLGDYVWTGFDYLGEASIGWLGYLHRDNFYPWNHAFCGDIDICGFKRPQSFYRDVLWQHEEGFPVSIFVKPPKPSFEMLPDKKDWSKWNWYDLVADWNWQGYEGENFEVVVYCMYPRVELFLNGNSLGKKETSRDNQWIATYSVPYESGELTAIGYHGAIEKSSCQLISTGIAEKIKMSADRVKIKANNQDLSYITVELLDENGVRNPKAENLIKFEIEGPGSILAVGNSNPKSPDSYQQQKRKAYQGRCLMIVKSNTSPGEISIKATSDGLQPSRIIITSEKNLN